MDGLTSSASPGIPPSIARQRNLILAVLGVLAVTGWIAFLNEATKPDDLMGMGSMGMGMDADSGPDLTMGRSWPLFFIMWVAMMAAMMFPAAAPMILMYRRMQRREPGSAALFTASYISLWFVFGAVAYLLSALVEDAAGDSQWVADNWGRVGGGLLVAAGIYQLTPLKDICLRHCRTPLSFVMSHWRGGRAGAVQMGIRHGVYCMGCCWLLFLILIPLGVMNVAAMVAVAAVVFAEKVLPRAQFVSVLAAVALIAIGLAVIGRPSLLPTVA